MSRMELNKGKLLPIFATDEQLAENYVQGDGWKKYYGSKIEYFEDNSEDYGICRLNGKWYKIQWEIQAGDMEDGFAEVNENTDNSIDFHTYHYNGCAHWTEVVESQL